MFSLINILTYNSRWPTMGVRSQHKSLCKEIQIICRRALKEHCTDAFLLCDWCNAYCHAYRHVFCFNEAGEICPEANTPATRSIQKSLYVHAHTRTHTHMAHCMLTSRPATKIVLWYIYAHMNFLLSFSFKTSKNHFKCPFQFEFSWFQENRIQSDNWAEECLHEQ